MSALLQGARRTLTGLSDLDARVSGLGEAVEAARGRLPDEDLQPAAELVERASARLRLSADHTVVALAGATGSGKSSTFNALVGLDLSSVGVRRPTTSWATACTWGAGGAQELLEWLGIPPRHQVLRDSMLDSGRAEQQDLQGLVLLDLPDHDSTETAHHLEVDRLVELADLMVWVLDPQKYADAAIHDRFLQPLSIHRDVMLVVLNHIDRIEPDRRAQVLADLRRLLDLDGLAGVPLLAISALTGEGVDQLRAELARRVAAKAASGTRIATDVDRAVEHLAGLGGDAPPRELVRGERQELVDAVADAAGVPAVVDAVRRSALLRSRRATGWPPIAWATRLRPDPLERLDPDLGSSARDLVSAARTSLPVAGPVQRARVENSVRGVADAASTGLGPAWRAVVRRAVLSRSEELGDRLDRAVTGTDLGVGRIPAWCALVRMLQWLLLLAAVAGAAWLVAVAVSGQLSTNPVEAPQWQGASVPVLLLVGGVALGVVLALVCRLLVRLDAASRARNAERRLRSGIDGVVEELVLAPMQQELDAYGQFREGLRRARG